MIRVSMALTPVELIGNEAFVAGSTLKIGNIVSRIRGMSVDIILPSGQAVVARFGTIKNGKFCPYERNSISPAYYAKIPI